MENVAGPSATPIKDVDPETVTPPARDAVNYAEAAELRVWVNRLAVRKDPKLDGVRLAIMPENKRLTPTGKVSDHQDGVVLRGTYFVDHWYEVKTGTGQTGWVFGGGVVKPGEVKAIQPAPDRISEPMFGDYDLTKWEKIEEGPEKDAGDFDVHRVVYKNVDRLLTIRRGKGEYAYFTEQTLSNLDGDPLKTRKLTYSNGAGEISEVVVDHTGSRPETYTRRVQTDIPYQQAGGMVERLTGGWTES